MDSAPAHEAAWRDALAELAPGLPASFRYAEHAGAATRDVVARLGVTGELADRLVRRKQRLYRRYAEGGLVTVMPGAHRLLDRLAATGRAAYLVTGGSRASVTRVLAACGLAGRLRGVLTADDVPWSKPDPRVYAHACRLWSVDPAEAVAVEDSAHGVAAATGAAAAHVPAVRGRPAARGDRRAEPRRDRVPARPGDDPPVTDERVCAVIPAAGQGTRLGLGVPKILLRIADGVTVWHLLHRRLRRWVDRIHVVLSPAGLEPFRRVAATGPREAGPQVSVSVQERPTGMGDAVFGAAPHWAGYDAILVVWGDQATLSEHTVAEVIRTHRRGLVPRITLPLVALAEPYVEYEYDAEAGVLLRVRSPARATSAGPAGSATWACSASAPTGWWPSGRGTGRRRAAARPPGRSTSCRSCRTCRGSAAAR